MNNQKPQKPTLTGQRFKTRKRGFCLYWYLFLVLQLKQVMAQNPGCIHFLIYSPTRWKGEIWPYSVSRKYRTRLEPNWHWLGRSCKVPGCLWRQAWLPPICRDTLWHLGGWRNAGWVGVNVNVVRSNWKSVMHVVRLLSVFAAPGGTLSDDMTRTDYCLFTAQEDLETMQAYAQVCGTWSLNTLFKASCLKVLIPLDFTEQSWFYFWCKMALKSYISVQW